MTVARGKDRSGGSSSSIAVAVAFEGDTPNEEYGGGRYAAPIAATILRKYFDKKAHPSAFVQPIKPE